MRWLARNKKIAVFAAFIIGAWLAVQVLATITPGAKSIVALAVGLLTARGFTRFDPTVQPVASAKQVRYAEIAFVVTTLLALLSLPSQPTAAHGLAGVLIVAGVVLGGRHLARRHQRWQPTGTWFGVVLDSWGYLPRWCAAVFLGGSIVLGGALNMYQWFGPLVGVMLAVVAGFRYWTKVRRRVLKMLCVGRALTGVLVGPEFDELAAERRIPVRYVAFDDDDNPRTLVLPLPARTAATSEEDVTDEVISRMKEFGLYTVVWDTGSQRSLTIQRIEPLPESLRYDGRAARDETIVWVGVGKATPEHATSTGATGTPKGATFDFEWDLRVEPHGIAVGLTGQGKSQTIQLVMMQLALAGWGLVLIDPKQVEFTPWVGRPGVLAVTTTLEAHVDALEALVEEQTQRYAMLADHGTNHIDRLPVDLRPRRVAIVIDEAVELLKKSGARSDDAKAANELKDRASTAVGSLLRLGRAAGLHVILGAQRADRTVLDGEFQNNLAFKILQGKAEPIERTMIGLNDVKATPGVAGRAVARTLKLPQTELQVAYVELDPDSSDLDRYLPVGGDRPEPARPRNPDITPVEVPESPSDDYPVRVSGESPADAAGDGDPVVPIVNGGRADQQETREHTGKRVEPLPEGEAASALEHLTGLGKTKEEIAALTAQVVMALKRAEFGVGDGTVSAGHLIYQGPPGTGKTTVARIVGSILRDLGVLKSGHVIEMTPKDVKAPYVGQSGPMADSGCDAAIDGVLFIDEAYGLTRDEFAREALEQIMVRAENDRERLVVILAGYTKEMDDLLDVNPGMRSRFPNRINFPAYNREELVAIAEAMIQDSKRVLADDARGALVDLMDSQDLTSRDWGNARSVRNLVRAAMRANDKRLTAEQAGGIDLSRWDLVTLTREDILAAGEGEWDTTVPDEPTGPLPGDSGGSARSVGREGAPRRVALPDGVVGCFDHDGPLIPVVDDGNPLPPVAGDSTDPSGGLYDIPGVERPESTDSPANPTGGLDDYLSGFPADEAV